MSVVVTSKQQSSETHWKMKCIIFFCSKIYKKKLTLPLSANAEMNEICYSIVSSCSVRTVLLLVTIRAISTLPNTLPAHPSFENTPTTDKGHKPSEGCACAHPSAFTEVTSHSSTEVNWKCNTTIRQPGLRTGPLVEFTTLSRPPFWYAGGLLPPPQELRPRCQPFGPHYVISIVFWHPSFVFLQTTPYAAVNHRRSSFPGRRCPCLERFAAPRHVGTISGRLPQSPQDAPLQALLSIMPFRCCACEVTHSSLSDTLIVSFLLTLLTTMLAWRRCSR